MVFKVRARKYEFSIFEKSVNFTWYKINRILLGSTCFRKLESDILRGHDTKKRSFSIEINRTNSIFSDLSENFNPVETRAKHTR